MYKRCFNGFRLLIFLFLIQPSWSQVYENAHYETGVAGLDKLFKKNLKIKDFGLEKDYHGTIVLRLQINAEGRLDSLYVWFSPTEEIGEAALEVMQKTRGFWIPAKKAGIPQNAWIQYTYNFCPHYHCGFTGEDYRSFKKKSRKAFLDGKREKEAFKVYQEADVVEKKNIA